MVQVSLKKILSKKERLSVINDIIKAISIPVCIQDITGAIILGDECKSCLSKYAVEVNKEIIGWVIGEEKASAVAGLLSHLAEKELEKKSLANEVLDKYREMTLVYDISQKINATLELKEVNKLIIEEARRLIESDRGAILLFNPNTGKLEPILEYGKEASGQFDINFKCHELLGSIVLSGNGEIINDLAFDDRLAELEAVVSSLICVPLKSKDRVIGAIAIGNSSPITYSAEDLKRLNLLASLAVSAIENAHLHEKQLQESRREALLFRLSSQIRNSLDLNNILETTVSEILTLLQIDRCLFSWYRSEITYISAICPLNLGSWGQNQAAWEVINEARNPQLFSAIGLYPAEKPDTFTNKLLDKEMVRIDNVKSLTNPNEQQFFLVQQDCTSVLAVPIQNRSGAIGVLSCSQSQTSRTWSEHEIELLKTVANQLAIAIDQAELYEQSRSATQVAQAQAQHLQRTINELQKTQAQLIQSEKMSSLGQLVAGVAHEINNPVNFIYANINHANAYAQDLLKLVNLYTKYYPEPVPEIQEETEAIDLDFVVEDLPKILSSMHMGVDRIRQIVISLRNFSRLEEAEMKPVNIHDGINSTLLILQHRLKGNSHLPPIQIVKEYAELPLVECYPAQLNQVFMNIISNAIDAIEDQKHPGIITICTQLSDSKNIVIRIRDNGSGMSEQVKAKLFDPFFTTKPVGKGTGLGMSISYQIIVEKHRGVLECTSQIGEGTEFLIQIPIQPVNNCTPSTYKLPVPTFV